MLPKNPLNVKKIKGFRRITKSRGTLQRDPTRWLGGNEQACPELQRRNPLPTHSCTIDVMAFNSNLWRCNTYLLLIFTLLIGIRYLAYFVCFKKNNLSYSFICVNPCWKRCCV